MAEYLINVVMAGSSYWAFAALIFAFGFAYRKRSEDLWTDLKLVSLGIFLFGLMVGALSPSNTYKNQVDYNRVQDQRQIESYREQKEFGEIVDRTRAPMTPEERAANQLDMRERVNKTE